MKHKTLTDFEIRSLGEALNLADGHAYQDLDEEFRIILAALPELWESSEHTPIPEAEASFRAAFAALASTPGMLKQQFFKVCPTASNTIDIIGAALAELELRTRLVEPTFDNLALLLRRRNVVLDPCDERDMYECVPLSRELLPESGAVFLVNPNNPTGRVLTKERLKEIAVLCESRGTVLVLDNSFRLYNRQPFDDYAILRDSGVSFISFEDTGKVWPTHDLKASLLFCSDNLRELLDTVYNETYLCTSRFTLGLLERFILATTDAGLPRTIWRAVDHNRSLLRRVLAKSVVSVDETAANSQISVEWLNCSATGLTDVELTEALADEGVRVLPGHQFFWSSYGLGKGSVNLRVALMKPALRFDAAVSTLARGLVRLGLEART